jgi:mono/diheme cytochrome c family protein
MLKQSCLSLAAVALLSSAFPAWSQELPDGPGKELVAAQCNSCHALSARVGAGYTATGWRTVMRMMINLGVPIPPDQLATMTGT